MIDSTWRSSWRPNPNFQLRKRIVDPQVRRKANMVLKVAKMTAPVDTGAYKRSLRKDRIPDGYRISATVDYAKYVEFGTRRMRAYRTLGRALDSARDA